MPRTKLDPGASQSLLGFLALVDANEHLDSPVAWLEKSKLNQFFLKSAANQASPEKIVQLLDLVFNVHTREEKAKLTSEAKRLAGLIRGYRTLPLKIWAICYYTNRRVRSKATKTAVSIEIYKLLMDAYLRGDDRFKPPKAETIRTEWLKHI